MAASMPARAARIPALQRQCLFRRDQRLHAQSVLAPACRTFSSTASRASGATWRKQEKALSAMGVRVQTSPSPKVHQSMSQQQDSGVPEDIGILQNTIVRAPFNKLPSPLSSAFWSYFWALLKSKGMAIYSRSIYKRCIYKAGWTRWLPYDVFNHAQLKNRAGKLYVQIYTAFAAGDMRLIEQDCLPPLAQQFQSRISSREVKMEWELKKIKSIRIMSHRAAPLGEDQPDTAFRQVVFRIESVQMISRQDTKVSRKRLGPARPSHRDAWKGGWRPGQAQSESAETTKARPYKSDAPDSVDNSETQTVVEYMVLQTRVLSGTEGEWKVQGFTQESTPATIAEHEAYWRRMLALQAGM